MRFNLSLIICCFCLFIIGCSQNVTEKTELLPTRTEQIVTKQKPHKLATNTFHLDDFERTPTEWGEHVTGVKTRFKTDKKEMALTFDACGGAFGNGYDDELMHILREESKPATLVVNERWIVVNEQLYIELVEILSFKNENHGTHLEPLSGLVGEA